MKRIILIVSFVLLIMGCSAQKGEKGHVDFTVVKQETYGGLETETGILVNSVEELKELYRELNLEDVPKVDFEKHSIVAVFMGQKRTGGYSIAVTEVNIKNDVSTVTTNKTLPSGGIATMALSSPYCIIEIPKATSLVVK